MSENATGRSLDLVIASVATQLMAANAASSVTVSQQVLAHLVSHFGVDFSYLRYNDRAIRVSRLIAEWPARPEMPDPDPIGLIYFTDTDPVFAQSENAKQPMVFDPATSTEDSPRHIHRETGRAVPVTSIASAPLLSGDVTTGTIGFVNFGERLWSCEELSALEAIASLFAQVQARVQAEEHLRYLVEHDDVTGLHNRRTALAHLDARLKDGEPGPVAAIIVDLDRTRAINNHFGHIAGDSFIRAFAERLGSSGDSPSLIARLGGDEFVVIPTSTIDAASAEAFAHRLQTTLREGVSIAGSLITRTVSIGVALGIPGKDTMSDLLRRAEQAVLAAKNTGGNAVAAFADRMSIKNALRNDIDLNLQNVIENGALHLRYQPEVDMRNGDILGTEALVRWEHPTRGLLSPDSFIGVAESINLACELGRWVLRSACSEFAGWRSRGIGMNAVLRVNVSPDQLVTAEFLDSVADLMAEFDLGPGALCLEITERMFVRDIDRARITLAALRSAGVRIAVDDFGTGYNSLSQLKLLPVDILKIDQRFVRELGSNPVDLVLVRAIIALAEALRLEVVAEGVETESAALTLLEHGCQRAQGYLLSRPVTGDDMESLLAIGRIPLSFSIPPGG